jgi:class 3 adenylate cyclase
MFIATGEVVAHALFAIFFLGWESGFGYYIFCLVPVLFYIPCLSVYVKITVTGSLMCIYGAAYLFFQSAISPVSIEPLLLLLCHYFNLLSMIVVLSCIAYYYSKAAHHAQEEVERQHKISEELLLNILPKSIAERLKTSTTTIVERHVAATILFADIAGFTKLMRQNRPERIVELLNRIFSRFDDLTEFYGLEKIKTIGDAYMAAGGLPEYREDHAEAVARLALRMQHTVHALNRKLGKKLIRMRIGIDTGSVIAGVIGKRKYTYDLWGDSVNIAARMESLCREGCIQVSGDTYRLLEKKFVLKLRGEIEVKGRGKMNTYYLIKQKEEHS